MTTLGLLIGLIFELFGEMGLKTQGNYGHYLGGILLTSTSSYYIGVQCFGFNRVMFSLPFMGAVGGLTTVNALRMEDF
jgi:hypothetical protein